MVPLGGQPVVQITRNYEPTHQANLGGAFLKSLALIGQEVNSRLSELAKMTTFSIQKTETTEDKLALWIKYISAATNELNLKQEEFVTSLFEKANMEELTGITARVNSLQEKAHTSEEQASEIARKMDSLTIDIERALKNLNEDYTFRKYKN